MKIALLLMKKKIKVRTLCENSKKLFGPALLVSDNQIFYDDFPKDKWMTKFFSYAPLNPGGGGGGGFLHVVCFFLHVRKVFLTNDESKNQLCSLC